MTNLYWEADPDRVGEALVKRPETNSFVLVATVPIGSAQALVDGANAALAKNPNDFGPLALWAGNRAIAVEELTYFRFDDRAGAPPNWRLILSKEEMQRHIDAAMFGQETYIDYPDRHQTAALLAMVEPELATALAAAGETPPQSLVIALDAVRAMQTELAGLVA